MEVKQKSEDLEVVAEDEVAIEARQEKFAKVKKDIRILEGFYKDTNSHWGDIAHRNIGHVSWAPKIYVDVQGHKYTKDIGSHQQTQGFVVEPVDLAVICSLCSKGADLADL